MKLKNDRTAILVSTLVCLLPMILSAALYGRLPEQIAVHWNFAGEPDGFAHKALAAFGLPGFMAAMNLVVRVGLYSDPKRARISRTMAGIAMWVMPVMTLVLMPITLFTALGVDIPINLIVPVLLGVLLILIGNYLPKSRQSYTVGIRLPWTLHDPDNWNKTHRLAGPLWIIGGIAMVVIPFLPLGTVGAGIVVGVMIAILVLVPTVYSYTLYRRSGNQDDIDNP